MADENRLCQGGTLFSRPYWTVHKICSNGHSS